MLKTALSEVDGAAGRLTIAGYRLEDFAEQATFEETVATLWGHSVDLVRHRELPREVLDGLPAAAALAPVRGARVILGGTELANDPDDPGAIVSRLGVIVAHLGRLRAGGELLPAREELGFAANFLWQLRGREPQADEVRALDTYLNTVIDHGFNASTYTARVIASTGSTNLAAVVGAHGALEGPLHGGAPGPALQMVFDIGSVDRAETYIRDKLDRGERLMGFGHRIYQVRDPRADVLARASRLLESTCQDPSLFELARGVEQVALRLLKEYQPERRLETNVEYYTALLLHALGLDSSLFTCVFAMSRAAGWLAHAAEQRARGRLIRPDSGYDGPRDLTWSA